MQNTPLLRMPDCHSFFRQGWRVHVFALPLLELQGGSRRPPGTLCAPQTGHLRMMAAWVPFDAKDENIRAMIEFGKTYQLS